MRESCSEGGLDVRAVRGQTDCLPAYAAWPAVVIVLFPSLVRYA